MKGIALLAVIATAGIAGLAYAQTTYLYVNTSGNVATVEAGTAAQAITTAPNIAPTSGVITEAGAERVAAMNVDVPTGVGGDPSGDLNQFGYISTTGDLQTVDALDAESAMTLAPDIAPTSGVIDLSEYNLN